MAVAGIEPARLATTTAAIAVLTVARRLMLNLLILLGSDRNEGDAIAAGDPDDGTRGDAGAGAGARHSAGRGGGERADRIGDAAVLRRLPIALAGHGTALEARDI